MTESVTLEYETSTNKLLKNGGFFAYQKIKNRQISGYLLAKISIIPFKN